MNKDLKRGLQIGTGFAVGTGLLLGAKSVDWVNVAKNTIPQGDCYNAVHYLYDRWTEDDLYPSLSEWKALASFPSRGEDACQAIVAEETERKIEEMLNMEAEDRPPVQLIPLFSGVFLRGREMPKDASSIMVSPPDNPDSSCHVIQDFGSMVSGEAPHGYEVFRFDELFLVQDKEGKIFAMRGGEELENRARAGELNNIIRYYWKPNELESIAYNINNLSLADMNQILFVEAQGDYDVDLSFEVRGFINTIGMGDSKSGNMTMDILSYRIARERGAPEMYFEGIAMDSDGNAFSLIFSYDFILDNASYARLLDELRNAGIVDFAVVDPIGVEAKNEGDKGCTDESIFINVSP
jgi:hypothetical protein